MELHFISFLKNNRLEDLLKYKYLNKYLLYSLCFFIFGHLLDALSTYYMINLKNLGVKAEINIMARWFFENFGMLWGSIIHSAISTYLILMPFLYIPLLKFSRKKTNIDNAVKDIYILVITLFISVGTISIMVAFLNILWPSSIIIAIIIIIIATILTGLLTMSQLDEKIKQKSAE